MANRTRSHNQKTRTNDPQDPSPHSRHAARSAPHPWRKHGLWPWNDPHLSRLGFAQAPAWVTRRSSVRFPSGAIIRTILKDVSPETLGSGATMFHEHLTRGYSSPPTEPQRGAARGATAPPGPHCAARSWARARRASPDAA